MRKSFLLLILILLFAGLLSACGGGAKEASAQTVEAYLQALVAGDADRLSTLSCKDWESQAVMELDSFQGVSASLDGLSCTQSSLDGDTALVTCEGDILATYNNEQQKLPVSGRTYQVRQEGGEWRVCGYR
jgi:hypothetical protein